MNTDGERIDDSLPAMDRVGMVSRRRLHRVGARVKGEASGELHEVFEMKVEGVAVSSEKASKTRMNAMIGIHLVGERLVLVGLALIGQNMGSGVGSKVEGSFEVVKDSAVLRRE